MQAPSIAAAVAALLTLAGVAAGDDLAPAVDPDEASSGDAALPADDESGAEPRLIPTGPDNAPAVRRTGHHRQLGMSGQLVTGSRFIKTYDGEYCGETSTETANGNATACFTRVPITLDLTATYGLTPRIELMLEVRLGLERDFGRTATDTEGPRLRHYAPGVRFFYNADERFKFFSTAQLALDATGYQDATGNDLGMDVALRNANGVMFDFHDAYGAYAFFGEEVEFGRWLEVGLEAGLGIQGRYP